MTDVKISTTSAGSLQRKRRKGPGPRSRLRTYLYESRFEIGSVASGGTGNISFACNPSILNSSEYSNLQTIFNEVRLIRATLTFAPRASVLTTVLHSSVILGTNLAMNGTTFTSPASAISVQNLERKKEFTTLGTQVMRYEMVVPRNLDYLPITADTPVIPSPYAGSPGVILAWSSLLTNSTSYFVAHLTTVHQLRSRV